MPIKLTFEALSREDATVLSFDAVINLMFSKLRQLNSPISSKLLQKLKQRSDDRTNQDVMNLLKSLCDPSAVPTKPSLNLGQSLMERLFEVEAGTHTDVAEHCQPENSAMTIEDDPILPKTLKEEFALFKWTGKRTLNLQRLYDALLMIKPTTTDVERVFSAYKIYL